MLSSLSPNPICPPAGGPAAGGVRRRGLLRRLGGARQALKRAGNGAGLLVALAPAASCWVKWRFSDRDDLFLFWAQLFALVPGLAGKFLRRGYYRLTLKACSADHWAPDPSEG